MIDQHDKQTLDIDEVVAQQGEQVGDKASQLENGCVFVNILCEGRDGERTLSEGQMLVDGTVVDGTLVKKGRIEWFPGSRLKFKSTLTKRANRLIAASGIPYGSLTAIPVQDLKTLISGLDDIKVEFDREVRLLEKHFDAWLAEHIKANPDKAELIRKLATTAPEFCRRFKFVVLPPIAFKAFLPEDEDKAVEVMKESIFSDVAKEADNLLKTIFKTAERKNQKAINTVRRLRDKVDKLSFVDIRFTDLVLEMDETLSSIPSTGYIEGKDLNVVVGMLHLMANAGALRTSVRPPVEVPPASKDQELLHSSDVSNQVSVEKEVIQSEAIHEIEEGSAAPSAGGFGEW